MGQSLRIAAAPGVELWVEVEGCCEPLVLVPGAGGSAATWDRLWPPLTAARTCVRYDLRGAGRSSDRSCGAFSHTDDLLALFDALELRRASLMGVSMGGRVSLDFALAHPDRVDRLVLISPGLAGWDWSDDWRARWDELVATARSGDLPRARELWFAHPLFATARRDPALAAELRAAICADPGREWLEDREAPCERPHVERLGELAPETLLLSGAEDLEDFRVIADALEAMAPRLRRRDLAGAGHLLQLERPAEIAAEVLAFLAEPSDVAKP